MTMNRSIDFYGMSTSLGLIYGYKLGDHINWTFIFTIFLKLFKNLF